MAIQIYSPDTLPADFGCNGKLYPIEDKKDLSTIRYDRTIQRTYHNLANVVGAVSEWIKSFFEPNYFKFIRVKTESSYSTFKSFMKTIYKKEKPFMVIDPASIEHDEESIFHQNMIGRFNMVDPEHDNIGAKLIYSLDIMKSDMFELVYRRNRYRLSIEILIMEQTMGQQINTWNQLIMNIRHNSKFLLTRPLHHLLPSRYIINIARLHGYDYNSDTFLAFLNSISQYPIIKKVLPNGQPQFYMEQMVNLQIDVPGIPNKDSPELSEAFEWGARITDEFIVKADLPAEFLFLLPEEYKTKYDNSIPEDPANVYMISPYFADMDWPTEVNGYTLTNRLDVMVKEDDDNVLDLLGAIRDYNEAFYEAIKECIAEEGKLSELVLTKTYANGSIIEEAAELGDDGMLTLHPSKLGLFTVNIYLHFQRINYIRAGHNHKTIGSVDITTENH